MWISALAGMSFRMVATYLAICHRSEPGSLNFATPMVYLERFLPGRGPSVARAVALLLLLSGLVNANLIQSNSVAHSLTENFGVPRLAVALSLAGGVAAIVLGGLRSIVRVGARLAPFMLAIYVGTGLLILLLDPQGTSKSLHAVLYFAFHDYSAIGGVTGYVVLQSIQFGISRGIFSHGSGMGMEPFFQGANTDHPARGALMAATVPVFDTLLVCTVTGLVILSNGFWQFWTGARLTVSAFGSALGSVGTSVVFSCLIVFALTTVISWAHFSERCFSYLGGTNLTLYRVAFCSVTFVGPFFPVDLVWSLADTLLGILLVMHLVPLSYILLRRGPFIVRDLESLDSDGAAERFDEDALGDDDFAVPVRPPVG
jgi:AGCS family alanine or glycine:cation symporter